jgi:hypothetical protein
MTSYYAAFRLDILFYMTNNLREGYLSFKHHYYYRRLICFVNYHPKQPGGEKMNNERNRRLSDIINGVPELVIQRNEPSLFRGLYRFLRIMKKEV